MADPPSQTLILLASAQSYRNGPFETAAKKLGVEVVLGEDIPLPFHKESSSSLPLDYQDVPFSTRKIKAFASEHLVGAILGLDDSGTLIAASAAQALGLAHNAPDSALAARNKHIMRQRFAEHGVPSPHFSYHTLTEDPQTLAKGCSYPCVLKPTTLAGSRGVMRADNPKEFIQRWGRLKVILNKERCNEFLVEDYLPGVEVALEGLMDDGHLLVLALFDKPDPLEGPYFEETIYVTPSRLPGEAQTAITEAARKAAEAIGLRNGPIHAELRYNDEGPWLLEIAGRSIGGLCSQTLRFSTNASLEELILRQAFGLDLSSARRTNGADGVMMIPIPEGGILKGVSGIEEASAVPLVDDVEITAPLNQPIIPLPEGNSYLGFIFAHGETPAEVEQALRDAHRKLSFQIMPELTILNAS